MKCDRYDENVATQQQNYHAATFEGISARNAMYYDEVYSIVRFGKTTNCQSARLHLGVKLEALGCHNRSGPRRVKDDRVKQCFGVLR